ncbi:multidrug ABC transporter ATP-binding protein [Acrocarpospora corrugata]|uniref:Multidrug ABC transporter ATP-binding protein n=1 Tax=Acrocarpospora corrugata TaxID=35763 RepID=A0A5M3WCR8_9ACTN|nr:ABC transporter ATP-binding protein [Acrocarpospora corrugata]GES06139.1 multidrug ABC transporter ATP-binding protein [Acrocarpospora corrugata]
MAVIEVNDLVKRYGRLPVVNEVSFSVEQGEIFGILGPNGAGKTTTVECAEGLRRPDSGSIKVLGLDPVRDRRELSHQVGVQLQESLLQEHIKVWEALDLYASFYRAPKDWRELLEEWGLADKRQARFATLSGGQKQRLFIALALVGDPKVAFLDELTTGLDPAARRITWELIKRIRAAGVTVVLVSHHMDEVEELCDRVAVFDRGRIVALDTPSSLISAVDADQHLRFRPLAPFDDAVLTGLPGVVSVTRSGNRVIVAGRGDFATAVTSALARDHVPVAELRVEQHTLDDAFLALTGRTFDTQET